MNTFCFWYLCWAQCGEQKKKGHSLARVWRKGSDSKAWPASLAQIYQVYDIGGNLTRRTRVRVDHPNLVHSLWEYKNKVQNWSFCWLCLAVSYLVVTKTKNKSLFYCFFNFVRSFRDKKRRKNLSGKSARQSCAKYHKKKTQILYFVLCLPQGMALWYVEGNHKDETRS